MDVELRQLLKNCEGLYPQSAVAPILFPPLPPLTRLLRVRTLARNLRIFFNNRVHLTL